MAIATLGTVVLDCPDPVALGRFYAELLGGRTESDGDGWVSLTGAAGTGLAFQAAPGFVPPKWPAPDASQQFHLDLTVSDLDAAEKDVLALGARALDADDRARSWRVYADPNALDLPWLMGWCSSYRSEGRTLPSPSSRSARTSTSTTNASPAHAPRGQHTDGAVSGDRTATQQRA